MKKTLCSLLFVLICGLLAAEEAVFSDSFEDSAAGKPLKNWYVGRAQGAESTVEVVGGGVGTHGKNVLKIVSRTPAKPHRFTNITTKVALTPGERYRLQFKAKGKNVGSFQWTFGKSWKTRFRCSSISENFETFTFDFAARPEEFDNNGKYMIQMLADDIADEILIDEITIVSLASRVIPEEQLLSEKVWPVPSAPVNWQEQIELPREVRAIRFDARQGNYTGSTESARLSGTFGAAFAPEGLVIWVKVSDPVIKVTPGSAMWSADSVQIRIDQTGSRLGNEELTDLELGFAPSNNKIDTWSWQHDRSLLPDECTVVGGLCEGGYRFRALLSKKLLEQVFKKTDKRFSFNFIVNNHDGASRKVWFLAPGIHTSAKTSASNLLAWHADGGEQMQIVPDEAAFWQEASGKIFLQGIKTAGPSEVKFSLRDTAGGKVTFSEKIPALNQDQLCRILFKQNASKLKNGQLELSAALPDGKTLRGTIVKRNIREDLLSRTQKAKTEFRTLAKERAKILGEWKNSNYLNVFFFGIERHLGFLDRDLARECSGEEEEYYLKICEVELIGVEESLQKLRQFLADGAKSKLSQPTWTYVNSPATCKDGYFTADAVNEKGERTQRPLLFAGYGHFQDVVRDLPVLKRLGANLIQIEIGPSSIFLPPGPGQKPLENITYKRYENFLEKAMKNACRENVKIALLISPHYPFANYVGRDRLNTHDANGRYVFYQRGNREMMKAYVKALFTRLAASPYKNAIESIVLSNEPNTKSLTMKSCFMLPEFETYMKKKFGSLAEYNRLTGKKYADCQALLNSGESDPVARYAFHSFKRDFFAEWHRWLADMIHEIWPEIPTSSKVMALHNYQSLTYGDAVDVELFGEATEINGNDNFCYYGSARWGSGWQKMAMAADLQYTLRKNAIANTENHIIPDGTAGAVIPQHIYTSTLQQFLHGAGSIVTWVWVDLDYQAWRKAPIDLKGGVFRRPSALLAQSEALLDANRASREIIAFNQAPVPVGILYSPTNILYNANEISSPTEELYTLLNFCGHKVGFLSERKAAAGNFRDFKVLFLPTVLNIERKAAEKLKEFVRNGGKIVTWKGLPQRDEFNRPLSFDVPHTRLSEQLTETGLFRELKKILTVIPRKAGIRVDHPSEGIGIVTREATSDGVTYLNLTNYNRENRIVHLPFQAQELLSGRTLQGKVEMKPLEVFFLKRTSP